MRRSSSLFSRASRALDRVGMTVSSTQPMKESFARHRSIMNLFDLVNTGTNEGKFSVSILHEQKLKLICDLFNSSANFGIDGVMDCTKRDPYRQSFNLSALFSKFESDMSSFIFCFTISINVF